MASKGIHYFENVLKCLVSCASKTIEEYGPAWTPLSVISKCTSMLALLRKEGDDNRVRSCQIINDYCGNMFGHEINDIMADDKNLDTIMSDLFSGDYDKDNYDDGGDYNWNKHVENMNRFYASRTCEYLIGNIMHVCPDDDGRIMYPSNDFHSLEDDIPSRELFIKNVYESFECMGSNQRSYMIILVPLMMSVLGFKTRTFVGVLDKLSTITLYTFMDRVADDVQCVNSSIPSVIGSDFYKKLMDAAEDMNYSEDAEVKLFIL